MQWAGALRRDLSARNQQIAITSGSVHELSAGEMPSVIFGRRESLLSTEIFHPASYRNICANPAWARPGAPPDQGPYRVAKSSAHSGPTMDGARLR